MSMVVTTTLPDAAIAQICEQVAGEARSGIFGEMKTRLERVNPGEMTFSVRGPGGFIEVMTFMVRVAGEGRGRRLSTHILSYTTSREMLFGFIPVSPRVMVGLKNYKKFNELVAARIQSQDPSASVTPDVRLAG
ncbi:MAG: hypothetical protein IRZ08_06730 [Frankia sp.]|nr:hypothetical protein [Frankia sp.]